MFEEVYAVETGDGTLLASSRDGTTEDTFPGTGEPGEDYDATASIQRSGQEVSVRRIVELRQDDPRFTVTYEIENAGEETIESAQFYQYVDYDVGSASGDQGGYDPEQGLVWQGSDASAGSVFTGFRASRQPVSWAVDRYSAVANQLTQGDLQESSSYTGDVGSALQWDLGSIEPGETTSHAIGFAAGDSRQDVELLLSTVENPLTASSEDGGDGDGGSGDGGDDGEGDDSSLPLPGFGVGAAAAGLGGGYAYARLRGDGEDPE